MSTLEIDFGQSKTTKIVGIDLGTTNSLVAVMELTGPRILSGIVPSVVSVKPSGEIIAGKEARERLITHPESSVYSVKRLMGRGREDVGEELKLFPFHLAAGHGDADGNMIRLQFGDIVMSPPEDLRAHILLKLKQDAEAALGEPVTQAVITVPRLLQRRATASHQGRRAHRGTRSVAAGE